jgi:hypothetical protein
MLSRRALVGVVIVSFALLVGMGGFLAVTFSQSDGPPALPVGIPLTLPPKPQEKAAEPSLPEGVGATPITPQPALPSVAAASVPPLGVTCPPGWAFFDNPVVHYSICYPPGWGFSNFSTANPLSTIPGRELYSLNILSPDAFPYPIGQDVVQSQPDVLQQVISVTAEVFPPGGKREGCAPSTPLTVSGVQGTLCEDIYDILPGPEVRFSPQGSRHTLVVFLPLSRPPELDPEIPQSLAKEQPISGFQLAIYVTGPTSRYQNDPDLQWQIANTVRLY